MISPAAKRPGKRQSRDQWLAKIRPAFAYPGFSTKVLDVFASGQFVDGAYRDQVMIVARVGNHPLRNGIPGDCCTYFLTETVTLDKGRIVRIERSNLYTTRLSVAGDSTDP